LKLALGGTGRALTLPHPLAIVHLLESGFVVVVVLVVEVVSLALGLVRSEDGRGRGRVDGSTDE